MHKAGFLAVLLFWAAMIAFAASDAGFLLAFVSMLAIAPLVLTLSAANAIFVGVFLSVGATLFALWRALRNFAGARADREARGYRGLRWAVTFAAIPLVVWCSVQSYARVFRVANPLTAPPAASPASPAPPAARSP